MATFKAIVEPHYRRSDGTYNVRIRVTHARRKKTLSTHLYVTADDMTKKLKLKTQAFIDAAEDLVRKYRATCNELGDRITSMSVDQVVDIIMNQQRDDSGFNLDFIAYGRLVARRLRDTGHQGNAKNYDSALNSLVRFAGRENIGVNEITVKFLQSYVDWIECTGSSTKKVKGGRAVSLYLSTIRALHNKAKMDYNDEDSGVIRIPFSPFAKIKIPSPPVTRKRALSLDQINAIIDVPYKNKACNQDKFWRLDIAKDAFLLSFALVGMNSVDLFNCTQYKDGRITYQRTKTKNRRADKAEISIRVEPEIKVLIDKYRDATGERVFNFYQHYKYPATFNWNVNKGLKLIGAMVNVDDLEFYAARHSWATIARNDANVDKYTVHTALNHVDESMRVTDIYIKKDNSLIDNANRRVLEMLDFSRLEANELSRPRGL